VAAAEEEFLKEYITKQRRNADDIMRQSWIR